MTSTIVLLPFFPVDYEKRKLRVDSIGSFWSTRGGKKRNKLFLLKKFKRFACEHELKHYKKKHARYRRVD